MKDIILNQISLASKNLSEKIQAHFSEMELADILIGMESLKEQINLKSIEIMSKACKDNDYDLFRQNLDGYMADSYDLANQFNAGEEANALAHLIFKDEEHIRVYWEYQNSNFNNEMKAANVALDEAIESLMELNVA